MTAHIFAVNEGYKAAFEALVKAHLDAAKWCAFWPMVGPQYASAARKLLVCGRALNGWESTTFSSRQDAADLVARCAGTFGPDGGLDNKLEWVESRWGQGKEYRTSRSAFWRVCRALAKRLGHEGDGWTGHIAWTNLMRVSPAAAGNPEQWSSDAQLPHAARLLALEVDVLQPDVLVMLTGASWFDLLRHQPALADRLVPEEIDLTAAKHVTFVGRIGGARVIVGPHPQGKSEEQIVEEIGLWL